MKLKTKRDSKTYTVIRGINIWISALTLVLLCVACFPDDSNAAKLIGARCHHHPETRSTRVVFEVEGQIGSHRLHSPAGNQIEVRLYNTVIVPDFDLDVDASDPILKGVVVKTGPDQSTILNLTLHQDIRRYKLFPLSNPNRIVIDLFGVADPSIEPQLSPPKASNRTAREQNSTLSPIKQEEINESSVNPEETSSQPAFQNREAQSGEPILNIQELLDQDELVLGFRSEPEDISAPPSIVWWILLGTNFLLLLGLVALGIIAFRGQRTLRRMTNQELGFPSQPIEEEPVQEDLVAKDAKRENDDNEDFEEILENTISQELDTLDQSPSFKRAFIDHSHANQEEELKQVRQELDSEDTGTTDAEGARCDDQGVKNKITELLGDDEILFGDVIGPELEEDERLEAQNQRLSRKIETARRLIDEGKSHTQIVRELKTTREEIALMLAIEKRS